MRVIWPWQDRDEKLSLLKASVLVLLFTPAIWIAYQVRVGEFGPVPLGGMTYWSGLWSTGLLLVALAITPMAVIFRWGRIILVRRMIGVTALLYAIGHIFIYFALRFWDFTHILHEMFTRISLVLALISTAGLLVLGLTSLDAAIEWMGIQTWNRLHSIIYVTTGLAVIHYLLSPDSYPDQYFVSGLFFWLMAWRALNRRRQGTDPLALTTLAVVASLFAAMLEVGWTWAYHDEDPLWTLSNNFGLALGISPAWKILFLALLATIGAAMRKVPQSRSSRMRTS